MTHGWLRISAGVSGDSKLPIKGATHLVQGKMPVPFFGVARPLAPFRPSVDGSIMDENQVAEEGREVAQSIKESAQEWKRKAQGTVRDAGAAADLYVHEYAWTTMVLIAAVAGVLGYLLGSSRR